MKVFRIGLLFIYLGLNAGPFLSRGRGSTEPAGALFKREDYSRTETDYLPSSVSWFY